DAGHELSDLAGVVATPSPRKPGSPTRPFFPLGRIAGVVRCQQCIGRSRGGCATKRCSGGCLLNGAWNSTHSGSNKVVLIQGSYNFYTLTNTSESKHTARCARLSTAFGRWSRALHRVTSVSPPWWKGTVTHVSRVRV